MLSQPTLDRNRSIPTGKWTNSEFRAILEGLRYNTFRNSDARVFLFFFFIFCQKGNISTLSTKWRRRPHGTYCLNVPEDALTTNPILILILSKTTLPLQRSPRNSYGHQSTMQSYKPPFPKQTHARSKGSFIAMQWTPAPTRWWNSTRTKTAWSCRISDPEHHEAKNNTTMSTKTETVAAEEDHEENDWKLGQQWRAQP